jgi:hypothetical protein
MVQYEIIETYDGLVVAEIPGSEEAVRRGDVVDPGPYPSFDDAYEAMMALKLEEEDDELD